MSSFLTARQFALSSIPLMLLAVIYPVCAEDEFNLRILELGTPLENTSALQTFLQNNGLQPGKYLTVVKWDREIVDNRMVLYVLSEDKTALIPQFSKADLRSLGVNVDSIAAMKTLAEDVPVGDISHYIAEASYDFQPDTQTLYLRIPQIYRDAQASGAIPVKYWDDGVPAMWTSYYVSGTQQSGDYGSDISNWLSLNSGVNLGAWRLRNDSTWSDSEDWDAISTVLQRDIKFLKSQLEVGQTYTSGELFDSVQMTGVKLETDTSMLPNSLQGFAPVVRGIANSDAKVTIRQNGYTIYQSNVSTGPFEIRDLSQVTAGSDLEVTVEEADGSKHSFIQASSSVPILQREGALKYSLAGGKYRDSDGGEEPGFGQMTLAYGLPYGITAYGGALGASMYQSALLGIGADLQRFGSLSVDVTVARTAFNDGRDNSDGLSWRAQYAKDFPVTDTTVTLASYRYSTSGFYTFQEALDQRNDDDADDDDDSFYNYRQTNNRRSRLQLNVSQSLGGIGSFYVNGYQQDYWDLSDHERSLSVGFSSSWQDITWSVDYSMTKTPNSDEDQQIAFMVNIPLSRWLANSWATYNVNSSKNGNTVQQIGMGGTALEDNNLSYNLQQSYTDHDRDYGASMSARYRGTWGEVGTGYSYAKDNKQWNYSAQGTVVAHSHGVTLGQTVQDAFAIVHIDDGAKVKVENGQGIYTDYWGNALVPNLTNYRRNTIMVNSEARDDLEIDAPGIEVVPTKGAVVMANYLARQGQRVLLTLRYGDGVVPFGAILSMKEASAIVGDSGEVYVTGLQGSQPFIVQWGNSAAQRCEGSINLPDEALPAIYQTTIQCH
ncbi:fimbrial biogenesis outer membrane usher protein [Salmonella enterica subsp. indica]|uniref:Fimbrial biogenesis outer membrane usher protein n=3 Tax=Salmonella enterica TaxID=28901 RepID=A0A5Y2QS25_SALER|nr:fimbria/pilus outer membrane usher protein [Salmonella enterica]EBP3213522.1 fimbrial biogenesis outer membrane usher protein [Salmonella enterica subsp. arizonae]ECI8273033.1 fimbrial biogenesis outer membrane usher protein [Salmonella enterica subsp. enterica]EDR2772016.1 fimbrial biogenesis outer membrane usher protein [Salmonella enterica subsp. enterica serovar Oslo]EEC4249043.1 fimbria/pilus outer membrane usher protein [Salmonella enterica subsp. diarizonae]HAE8196184.1 fimbrial biog